MWDDKHVVLMPVLSYPTQEGSFVFSMDASDLGVVVVLEQEQEENRMVVRNVMAYASKV